MNRFALVAFAGAVLSATAALAAGGPAVLDQPAQTVALDSQTTINGVAVACTGIGDTRADAKWATYPIRVEFSGARNEYMSEAVAALIDGKGKTVAVVRCDGPWLLLKPAPGDYSVFAKLVDSPAKPRSARFTTPKSRQQRIVLQFPDS